MTFQRDLAWKNLEADYQASISHKLARYAVDLRYDMLPQGVVHQAKRCLLDALGCAIGAYEAPGRPICEETVKEIGGKPEATLFCSGLRTNALNATLYNGFLIRFLDYNDLGGGGHNSDAISSLVAISEREKAAGRDLLTSLVISYELGQRVIESAKGLEWEENGWCFDIRGGLSMPPSLGKLMGMNEAQIANAIGLCASHTNPLGILDANNEENSMGKNLRFCLVAYQAILACILAKKGFTGPLRVVEGDSGLRQAVYRGEMDLERLTDFSGWRILRTRHKVLCTNGTNSGTILATLAIVKENNLKPEDIRSVRIRATPRQAAHTVTTGKKYPRTAENADHSTFYGVAFAIKERSFGPESGRPEYFTDPVILDLIEKITVEADKTLSGYNAISEITTKAGQRFEKRIDTPHGLGNDPLTDQELEEKFRAMAIRHMEEKQIKKIFDTVWNAEKLDDIGKLAALMVFPSR
jgi:2-methylcitrate dehydratase